MTNKKITKLCFYKILRFKINNYYKCFKENVCQKIDSFLCFLNFSGMNIVFIFWIDLHNFLIWHSIMNKIPYWYLYLNWRPIAAEYSIVFNDCYDFMDGIKSLTYWSFLNSRKVIVSHCKTNTKIITYA